MEAGFIRVEGRLVSTDSNEGKELLKWNTPRSQGGMRPDGFEAFPKMLYMANARPDGVISVMEQSDSVFGGLKGAADTFNRRCQRIVGSEAELRRALEDGWRETPAEALERRKAKDQSIADAAAHRHFEDRRLSEKAQAQAAAVDAATSEHVPEIPEQPRARRGRPPKHAAA